ncbi:hypothetical protein SRHO_G00001250 [Serrasalmus rhombeus]
MWMLGIDLLDELSSTGRGLKLLSALPQANSHTIKYLKTEGKKPGLSFRPPDWAGIEVAGGQATQPLAERSQARSDTKAQWVCSEALQKANGKTASACLFT